MHNAVVPLWLLGGLTVAGCSDLVPADPSSLLSSTLHRSEVVGFVAGLGTTFAAVPDLYYGLLIASRPVVAWNVARW